MSTHTEAKLIECAFTYAREHSTPRDAMQFISDYVRAGSSDRRYRLHWNAASSDLRSALVTYRGTRYYVVHDYPTDTYSASRA